MRRRQHFTVTWASGSLGVLTELTYVFALLLVGGVLAWLLGRGGH